VISQVSKTFGFWDFQKSLIFDSAKSNPLVIKFNAMYGEPECVENQIFSSMIENAKHLSTCGRQRGRAQIIVSEANGFKL